MDKKATANTESSVSNVDAIAAQEAIEDQRVKVEQDRSGGALYVRPQATANTPVNHNSDTSVPLPPSTFPSYCNALGKPLQPHLRSRSAMGAQHPLSTAVSSLSSERP
jgi:hypothetical protein